MQTTSSLEQEILSLVDCNHSNHLRKKLEFYQFITQCFETPELSEKALKDIVKNCSDVKTAFIAITTLCLLNSQSLSLLERFSHKFTHKYLVTLEVHLRVLNNQFLSAQKSETIAILNNTYPSILENIKTNLIQLETSEIKQNQLKEFLSDNFKVSCQQKPGEVLQIGILLDDLNPSPTATLTKLVFDLIAVLLEHTQHKIYLFSSRLQTPDNSFWLPTVHQTKMLKLATLMQRYNIPKKHYKNRVSLIYLNQHFYRPWPRRKLKIDVMVTYPFKHKVLERSLYQHMPVVECEIMSGISDVKYCDIIVPSGMPEQDWLTRYYSQLVLILNARRKFQGVEGSDFQYLSGIGKFIVTAGKNFDKRLEGNLDEFLTPVGEFLKRNSNLSWIMVGGSTSLSSYLKSNFPDLDQQGRLFNISFESDLPGLFKRASLYVQPPMIGGGRVPAIAIENDCPALSYNFGDCTRYMPRECQFNNHRAMFKKIENLFHSDQALNTTLQLCKQILLPSINAESAFSYEAAIKRAKAKFLARQKTTD